VSRIVLKQMQCFSRINDSMLASKRGRYMYLTYSVCCLSLCMAENYLWYSCV